MDEFPNHTDQSKVGNETGIEENKDFLDTEEIEDDRETVALEDDYPEISEIIEIFDEDYKDEEQVMDMEDDTDIESDYDDEGSAYAEKFPYRFDFIKNTTKALSIPNMVQIGTVDEPIIID